MLPPKLGRLVECTFLGVQRQYLEGVIPYLKSSLEVLALQANDLKIFLGTQLSRTEAAKVCLFSNRLSCHPPKCSDDANVSMSLTALGNQLLLPGRFPSWVTPMEHDQVFWTSSKEGRSLLFKIIFASILLGCALAKEFWGCRWFRDKQGSVQRRVSITWHVVLPEFLSLSLSLCPLSLAPSLSLSLSLSLSPSLSHSISLSAGGSKISKAWQTFRMKICFGSGEKEGNVRAGGGGGLH